MTQTDTLREDYLMPMIRDFQQLGVRDEKGVYYQDGKIRFTYPNWNITRPEQILKNGSLVSVDTDYTMDYVNGWLTPVSSMGETDDVVATYYFKYFTDGDLNSFLDTTTSYINAKNPGSSYTTDTIDLSRYLHVVVHGAYIECLKRILLDNMIWKNNLIWANAQGAQGLLSTILSAASAEYTLMMQDMTRRQFLVPHTVRTGRYGQDYTITANNFWRFTVLGG